MTDTIHVAPVPAWASFFTPAQYGVFVALVEADLRQRGLGVGMHDGVVSARLPDGQVHQLGLQNLAQMCLREPEVEWAATVEEHFTMVLNTPLEDRIEGRSFEELRPLLKVRLYADEFPDGIDLVKRPVAPGVAAVLTLDLPSTIRTVAPRQLEEWGQTAEALLDWGTDNALDEDEIEQSSLDDGEGTVVQMLAGESFFVATQLLGLADWLPEPLPNGALVAIPQRHRLLFYPIEDLGVIEAVSAMLRSTSELYRQGPGSLSPDLFWWRDGQLSLLPSHEEDDGTLVFSPPAEFVACIERMRNLS